MPIDFPASPALNQTYTFGDRTWVWNGTGWRLQATAFVAGNGVSLQSTTISVKLSTILSLS